MYRCGAILVAWIFVVYWGLAVSAQGESVADYAVRVGCEPQLSPPQLTLRWPPDPGATGYVVYRKLRDETSWGSGVVLPATATAYADSSVVSGVAYEYDISKTAPTYYGEGYIYAGMEVPLVHYRGKVILIVENSFTPTLSTELLRLQQDLVGDGWSVLRHDVPRMAVDPANSSSTVWASRSNELTSVKALIKADYEADPSNVKAVFLFGHVPVPYSGKLAPDGHGEHYGAWPADAYYADMSGVWTDTTWNTTTAADPRNWNVPGDGKFDQVILAGNLGLQVGRVDMANLPAFTPNEAELLRQYLNKDHAFRHREITAQRRGWIDDNLGISGAGAPVAVNGWRNFSPFFGETNINAGPDWLGTLSTNSHLWGYGCGGGTYTSCSGVATTSQLAVSDPAVVFTMFFGSYFGDWDSQDNLLRAAIATPTYTLTSAWVGRPYWQFHHMALGETIGFSTRLSQNNNGFLYDANSDPRTVHIALMGDPTLRMHVVAPPSGLTVISNGAGAVFVSWTASSDSVLGYHVYRAATAAGPFTRINSNLIASTTYSVPETTTNVYMVRAVKLEVSGSGSYYNASQGIFQSLDGSAGAPLVVVRQPTNGAVLVAPTNLSLAATIFDPANRITNVSFYANGVKIGGATGVSQSAIWSNAPTGNYSLTARASCLDGLVTNSSPVNIVIAGDPPLLSMSAAAGLVQGSGVGMPARLYRVEYVNSLVETNWQTLLTATSSSVGVFQFSDTASSTQKFYRAVFP